MIDATPERGPRALRWINALRSKVFETWAVAPEPSDAAKVASAGRRDLAGWPLPIVLRDAAARLLLP